MKYLFLLLTLLKLFNYSEAIPAMKMMDLHGFNDKNPKLRMFKEDDFKGDYSRFMEISKSRRHLCPSKIHVLSNGERLPSGEINLPHMDLQFQEELCDDKGYLKLKPGPKLTPLLIKKYFSLTSTEATAFDRAFYNILNKVRHYYAGVEEMPISCGNGLLQKGTAVLFSPDSPTFGTELRVEFQGAPKILFLHDERKSCAYYGRWLTDEEKQKPLSKDKDVPINAADGSGDEEQPKDTASKGTRAPATSAASSTLDASGNTGGTTGPSTSTLSTSGTGNSPNTSGAVIQPTSVPPTTVPAGTTTVGASSPSAAGTVPITTTVSAETTTPAATTIPATTITIATTTTPVTTTVSDSTGVSATTVTTSETTVSVTTIGSTDSGASVTGTATPPTTATQVVGTTTLPGTTTATSQGSSPTTTTTGTVASSSSDGTPATTTGVPATTGPTSTQTISLTQTGTSTPTGSSGGSRDVSLLPTTTPPSQSGTESSTVSSTTTKSETEDVSLGVSKDTAEMTSTPEPSPEQDSNSGMTVSPSDAATNPSSAVDDKTPTPSPSTSPPAGDSACFPASAKVLMENGERVRMDSLQVGDIVHVGDGEFSEVIAFTHRDYEREEEFVRIKCTCGEQVDATPGHYMYTDRGLVSAGEIRIGDNMLIASGGKCEVNELNRTRLRGVINPQTRHGAIDVDGVLASTYTKTIMPACAHSLLSPLRLLNTVVISGLELEKLAEVPTLVNVIHRLMGGK